MAKRVIIGKYVEKDKINFDLEALNLLVKECIIAIKNTHKDFPYSPNTFNASIYSMGIYILVINELIKEPNLTVYIFWDDINDICKLDAFELTGDVFPNDLSADERLALQKYITRKIWEEYKNNGR